MPYATRQDMETRFGLDEIARLIGLLADTLEGEEAAVAAVLADADAVIDASLAVSYELPLTGGMYPLLRDIACDLARADLYKDVEDKTAVRRADLARSRLKKLASGELRLVTDDGIVAAGRHRPVRSGPSPLLTRTDLEDF